MVVKARAGKPKKGADGSKARAAESKAAVAEEVLGVEKATEFAAVELKAPKRTGRTLKNVGNALDEFEFRLEVAEKYLSALKVALPGGESFLAVGWTAARILREAPADLGDGVEARNARSAMVVVAGVVRNIVVRTTQPGDVERDQVLLGQTLNPKLFASVEQCEQILEGAKGIQGAFPALTDELLKQLAEALDAAKKASGVRKNERTAKAVERLSESDQRQLATDVLLDCSDHLGSAALSTLRVSNPAVVERLCRALEPDHNEGPATPPAPA